VHRRWHAHQAWASKYLWVHQADAYEKTDGNKVTPLLSGEIYYKQLAGAIAQAQSSICMLGWQINWDVMLTPGLRLYDAILKAVQANPHSRSTCCPGTTRHR
jgi:phosphatidylserine/phosphatidylglycerophosphate/cardiolipin synthase-like enzyme